MVQFTIDSVIEQINLNIGRILTDFPISAYGLSEPAIVQEIGGESSFPAIFNLSGEGIYPFVDDNSVFGCYHRLLGKNYITSSGFGRSNNDVELTDLLLICWGDSEVLKMNTVNVESNIIVPALPKYITIVSSNFDKKSVFAGEFSGYNYNLTPETILFSVRYRVRNDFNRACLETIV